MIDQNKYECLLFQWILRLFVVQNKIIVNLVK